jgi:hypothetical protein
MTACAPAFDQSEPWWLRVVPGSIGAVDAALSEDQQTLWFVTLQQGALQTLMLSRANLADPAMPVEQIGVLAPVPGQPLGAPAANGIDIDIELRPGTNDLYMYIGGLVVRFRPGSLDGELVRPRVMGDELAANDRGGIAFMDANTLSYVNERTVELYTMNGDEIGERRIISDVPMVDRSGVGRQVANVNDQIWVREEGGAMQVYRRDGQLLSKPVARTGWPLAASPGGTIWINPSNPNVGYCVEPVAPDGGAIDPANSAHRPQDAAGCSNRDIAVPPTSLMARRADISPDGHTLVLVSEGFILLGFERRPVGASQDLTGTWCPGLGTQFTFDGQRLTGPKAGGLDDLFATVLLEGSGDVRTVRLLDPDPVIADNIVRSTYDYFFKRTGDTLVVTGPITLEQAKRSSNGGYQNRSGFYYRSATPDCSQ